MLDATPRLKMMIDKLYDQYQRGCIDDSSWEGKFILDIRERMKMNAPLSEKQVAKIEDLFERN